MDKQQIKTRFFGAHIGCKVSATNAFGNGEYILSGVSTLDEGALMVFTEDGGSFSTDITDCKLVLRPLSSLTGSEMAHLDAISIHCGKNKMAIGYMRFDYLRSINVCVPFMGLDPITEGWAILDEKFSANAQQETKEEEEI